MLLVFVRDLWFAEESDLAGVLVMLHVTICRCLDGSLLLMCIAVVLLMLSVGGVLP